LRVAGKQLAEQTGARGAATNNGDTAKHQLRQFRARGGWCGVWRAAHADARHAPVSRRLREQLLVRATVRMVAIGCR
jgi:hypothetical protein